MSKKIREQWRFTSHTDPATIGHIVAFNVFLNIRTFPGEPSVEFPVRPAGDGAPPVAGLPRGGLHPGRPVGRWACGFILLAQYQQSDVQYEHSHYSQILSILK